MQQTLHFTVLYYSHCRRLQSEKFFIGAKTWVGNLEKIMTMKMMKKIEEKFHLTAFSLKNSKLP